MGNRLVGYSKHMQYRSSCFLSILHKNSCRALLRTPLSAHLRESAPNSLYITVEFLFVLVEALSYPLPFCPPWLTATGMLIVLQSVVTIKETLALVMIFSRRNSAVGLGLLLTNFRSVNCFRPTFLFILSLNWIRGLRAVRSFSIAMPTTFTDFVSTKGGTLEGFSPARAIDARLNSCSIPYFPFVA